MVQNCSYELADQETEYELQRDIYRPASGFDTIYSRIEPSAEFARHEHTQSLSH